MPNSNETPTSGRQALCHAVIPDPAVEPTLQLWPTVGRILHMGRSATYDAAERGEIPTIRLGRKILVPTAALRRMLQLDSAA